MNQVHLSLIFFRESQVEHPEGETTHIMQICF